MGAPLPPYNASDPSATFLNSSCLDLLMIELVPMAYRVVNEVDAAALDDRIPAKAGHESVKSSSVASNVRDGGTTSTAGGTIGGVGAGGALASMGINATVQAETSELPGATFQIKSIVAK